MGKVQKATVLAKKMDVLNAKLRLHQRRPKPASTATTASIDDGDTEAIEASSAFVRSCMREDELDVDGLSLADCDAQPSGDPMADGDLYIALGPSIGRSSGLAKHRGQLKGARLTKAARKLKGGRMNHLKAKHRGGRHC